MKRDLDLCRLLPIKVEELGGPHGWLDIDLADYSSTEVSYHVRLLAEAGLIEAQDLTTLDGPLWRPKRLTWAGHEFLDSARNDRIWTRAKNFVLEKSGTLTLELLKTGLSEVGKQLLADKLTRL